jgi:hypothetical protein
MASGLARLLDVRHRSNVFVIAATFAAAAIGLLRGIIADSTGMSVASGVVAGGATFLGWAIARELDPDATATASLAAVAAFVAWWIEAPGLLVSGAALLAARIVARTTGRRLITADLVFLVAFAIVTGARPNGVVAAMCLGVAMVVATDGRPPASQLAAGVAAIGGALIAALVTGGTVPRLDPGVGWWLFLIAASAAAVLTPLEHPTSMSDRGHMLLERRHLRRARWMVAVIAVASAIAGGGAGVEVVSPMLAAMVALPVVELAETISRRTGRPATN